MKALITKSKLMNLYKFNASSPYDIGRNDLIMELLNPTKPAVRLHKLEKMLTGIKFSELLVHMRDGNKLACVKLVKEETGIGLKDAKDLYENFELYSYQTKKYEVQSLPSFAGIPHDKIKIEYAE